ncbi:hypothetical protein AURDEDRAFT_111967 [Auricularia subglabra TFB-10046 SS5]|nr:hypothetical protein AURDEDRAFT_111967 [Auricularia subglabra TFB-10046 SS5]
MALPSALIAIFVALAFIAVAICFLVVGQGTAQLKKNYESYRQRPVTPPLANRRPRLNAPWSPTPASNISLPLPVYRQAVPSNEQLIELGITPAYARSPAYMANDVQPGLPR